MGWTEIWRLNRIFQMLPSKNVVPLLILFLCAGFLCSATHAQERCSVELKLLLSPMETQPAKSTLNLKKETPGFVYFFDTDSLDLLTKGLIVRLRRGADSDVTVKLRRSKGEKLFPILGNHENFKCEEDITGNGTNLSYSISRKYTEEQLPKTVRDIRRLLSQSQSKLLKEAHISIDWSRVKKIVKIKSTTWESRAQAPIRKVTLEGWEWPNGKLLEISFRARPDHGPPAYAELQKLANENGFLLSPIQGFKTSIVLESVIHARAK